MKHLGTQTIETGRLILRRFVEEDAKAMFENWAADEEVTKYLTWPAHDKVETSQIVLKEWIACYKKEDYYQWAIVLKENGDEPIGSISVVSFDNNIKKAEIGYCIGTKWWNQGITSEALKSVIDFMIDEVGMQRVEARHDPSNPNSGAVMRKCGMQYEGTLRQADWNNQGIVGVSFYAILSADRK